MDLQNLLEAVKSLSILSSILGCNLPSTFMSMLYQNCNRIFDIANRAVQST